MDKILVTGGSGFLGVKLIERLVNQGETNIRVVARNEGKLIELQQKFPNVELLCGDIADQIVCEKVLKNIDVVYHLSAMKHIGIAEKQPYQTVSTNVLGTMNLLDRFEGHTFLAISTDKAAQMKGVYGASKFLMEKLIEEYSEFRPDIKYRVVRYGNVLYSTGSVLCKWKELIEQEKQVIITDPEATRFFWTIDQAIDLIFECLEKAPDSKPYIPEMKGMRMGNLLYAMWSKYAPTNALGKLDCKEIGLQPGENKHETMDGKIFSNEVAQYTVNEIMKLI